MSTFQRDLNGLADLYAALDGLDVAVRTRIGVAANRASAKRLLARLIAVAPYLERKTTLKKRRLKSGASASYDYGHLRDNLRVRRTKTTTPGRIRFQVSTGNAFWGYFLEIGTANMRAHPWMRPAVEAIAAELIDIQCHELGVGIDREARRVARRATKMLSNGRNG